MAGLTKPSLSLSSVPPAHSPSAANNRRITSWGSAVSFDTEREMTPLPSPSVSREWGYLPASTSGHGQGDGWSSLGRSSSLRIAQQAHQGGRGRSSSVFEEMRDLPTPDQSGYLSSGGGWSDAGSGSAGEEGRSPPTRSKTLSFFDSTPAVEGEALSPPPNPPSRGNSLNKPGGRGSALSSSTSSSGGSWLDRADPGGIFGRSPPVSTTPPRIPSPERPFVSSPNEKPLLHALQTTSLRAHLPSPAGSPNPASSRPMTALPTPAGSSPPLRGARFLPHPPPPHHSNRPPPIDLSSLEPPLSASSTSAPAPVTPSMDEAPPPLGEDEAPKPGDLVGEYTLEKLLGKGAFSRVALARRKGKGSGELVALKMIAKKSWEGNERMRISVVREVEVLKNIHHPSLISLSASFSTASHTVLVLDYASGGELFDFLADWHPQMEEPLARRIFGELADAVGWMHQIGLVHRDIKLENILLLSRPFPCTSSDVLSSLPTPSVKLTDFGLSRFISPSQPLLSTRCGSEAYAAPELIMGRKYDGRKTDAWALGVVLFALVTGVMPFVEGEEHGARRGYLMKIAKGDYSWPASPAASARLVTPAVKALASRLLVRDPMKRARVEEVWDAEWMQGEGRPMRVEGRVESTSEGEADLRASWARRDSGM